MGTGEGRPDEPSLGAPGSPSTASACPHCGAVRDDGDAERCASCGGLWVLEGRYELGALLGRGGTAAVYRGYDRETRGTVAIKVLEVKDARDWKTLDLFERGTAILRSLDHASIPRVHAFLKDGVRAYQVREHYEAGSLEALVAKGLRLDRKRVHVLLKELLELLDYLHTRVPPVLHRDIKPANIMFSSTSATRAALVDFDAAAAHGVDGTGTTIVVSPGYSAPEQLAGDAQPASDLYSLGMTMLFVLTQRVPRSLPRMDGRPDLEPVLAGLEPATRRVIARLCEQDLQLRYRRAREALRDLAGIPGVVAAAPAAARGALTRKLERGGLSLFRIAVGVLLGVAIGYFFLVTRQEHSGERTSARGIDAR